MAVLCLSRQGVSAHMCMHHSAAETQREVCVQERRTTILEHHLFEKTFVVETRLVGERPLPGDARVRPELQLCV